MNDGRKMDWGALRGRALGAHKVAAKKIGVPFDEYKLRLDAGDLWCSAHKAWHQREAFWVNNWSKRGRYNKCLEAFRTGKPKGWHERPAINPVTGRAGPTPKPGRDGDRLQARERVNHAVKAGRMPRPSALACAGCGHVGDDRRHEYDHHKGYAAEHQYDVEPVCVACHHERERSRDPLYPLRSAKLTPAQALHAARSNAPASVIAKDLGVTRASIVNIRQGICWSWLTGIPAPKARSAS